MYGSHTDVNRVRKSINAPKIQRQHVVNNHTPSSAKPVDVISFEMPKSPEAMILAGTGADLTKGTDYTYSVKDLRMEYDIINQPSMSLDVKSQYDFGVVVPFKRYIKYRFEEIKKNDSVYNLKINALCKFLSHVMIFAINPNDQKDWNLKEVFKNLDLMSQ